MCELLSSGLNDKQPQPNKIAFSRVDKKLPGKTVEVSYKRMISISLDYIVGRQLDSTLCSH